MYCTGDYYLHKSVSDTAKRIKLLEIQGARNVAIAALQAIEEASKGFKAKTKASFITELSEAKNVLFNSRETEPLMRNLIRQIIYNIESSPSESTEELASEVSQLSKMFLQKLELTKEKIAKVGSKRIFHHARVLTHCHSSTVTKMLHKAKLEGKTFEVVCTESRPVFQGRLTAKEARTPFYVVSELLKFDPETVQGGYERIEERSQKEVWPDHPPGLIIRNPAFDVTRREFIHGIICEEGIISPHSISELMHRKYPLIFENT